MIFLLSNIVAASHWLVYVFPISRLIDFAIGIFLFKVSCEFNKRAWVALAGGLVEVLCLSAVVFIDNDFFSSIAWVVPSCMIIYSLYYRNGVKGNSLVWLGNLSFELFLIHQVVIRYVGAILRHLLHTDNHISTAVISFGISIVAATIWKKLTSNGIIKTYSEE